MNDYYLELREYGGYGQTIKTIKTKKLKSIQEGIDLMKRPSLTKIKIKTPSKKNKSNKGKSLTNYFN